MNVPSIRYVPEPGTLALLSLGCWASASPRGCYRDIDK